MLGQICARVWNCTFAYETFPEAWSCAAPVHQFQAAGPQCCILWPSVDSHHWSVTWSWRQLLTSTEDLSPAPKVSVFVREHAQGPCILQIQKASASFSRWFLCATSSVTPAWWSFLQGCTSLPPPPFQHTANAAHAHSFPLPTCTHTRRPRLTDVPGYAEAQVNTLKGKKCARGVFRSEYNHGYGQTNGKYTGKESTQEAGLLEL